MHFWLITAYFITIVSLNNLSFDQIGSVKNKVTKPCTIYHFRATEGYITAEIQSQIEYIAVDGDTDS